MGFTFLIVGKNHKGNNIRKIRKLYEIEISVFINKVWLENSHVCLAILYDFFFFFFFLVVGGTVASQVKNPPANAGDTGSIPELGRFPWRRRWQRTAVFLPGKSHGKRSLAGCSPRGRRESDTTECSSATWLLPCTSAELSQEDGDRVVHKPKIFITYPFAGKKIYWPCFQARPTANHIAENSRSSLCFRMGQIMQRQVSEWT